LYVFKVSFYLYSSSNWSKSNQIPIKLWVMALPERCWAPCFTLNSGFLKLKSAAIIISLYTALIHLLILFYSIYILMGGQSDTFFSPLFEFNRYGMTWSSVFLIIYSISYIFFCSFGLIHGINTVWFYLESVLNLFIIIQFIVCLTGDPILLLAMDLRHSSWNFVHDFVRYLYGLSILS